MATLAAPPSPASVPPPPRFRTAGEWHQSLGNVPLDRVLFDPPPGTATPEDVVRLADDRNKRVIELVSGTLVEKPVGLRESIIAGVVITLLNNVVRPRRLGVVSGEAGTIRMLSGNLRAPDVAFFRREDMPDGQLPREPAPRLAPALAVEVLSPGKTDEEMRLKLADYFQSGVRLVWVLDPAAQAVRVYDAPDRFRQLTGDDALDGGDLLPGFSVRVSAMFES